MGTVTLTSGCSSSSGGFPHNLGASRDVSFSSYVNGTDESFVLKLSDQSNGSLQDRLYSGRKKAEDGEIGVFGAEKYFSGGMDEEGKPNIVSNSARRSSLNQNEEGFGFQSFDPIKPKVQPQPRTPSLISESSIMRSESSWDSQSVLLTNVVLRNPPRNKTKMMSRKSLLASLRSKCSCSDKNSVETDEYITKDQSSITKEPGPEVIHLAQITDRRSESRSNGLQREKCFAFPLANSGNPAIKLQLGEGDEGKPPRKSIEIFGSPILEKGHKCLSLERRLTMLSWEATPRIEDPGNSNDTESDASSDLFEIDSLSSRVTPFLARQESDNMSAGCITPTTCYAPSEASIEWSVVTGSVADYSVMSDCDELRPPSVVAASSYTPAFISTSSLKAASKEVKRRPGNILSGCKNDKAVRVAGDAYVRNDKAISEPRRDQRGASLVPLPRTTARFEAETTLTGFGSPSSFSRSHSPHASRLLYI